MCLLALFFHVVEDAPVIVGANREEQYERGGEPPQILPGTVQTRLDCPYFRFNSSRNLLERQFFVFRENQNFALKEGK